MGSNMAEAHPVGFQWVMEAKARGAKVIHIDPRFTRTSALADTYVPIRAGSDIAFLGGVINYILSNDLDFREYVAAYTNAATLISDEYRDTEDLDGLFSGYDAGHRRRTTAAAGSTRARSQVDEDTGDSTEHKEQTALDAAGSGGAPLERHHGRRHRGPDAAAPALRVPDPQAALRPLHPGDGRARLRHAAGAVPGGLRGLDGELGPGAHHGAGLQRRLDAAQRRRAVHPRRRDRPAAAGQHRPPGRRRVRLARARQHPGLARTSRRCSTCCPATCRCPARSRPTTSPPTSTPSAAASRRASGAAADTYMVSLLKEYFGEHATAENDFGFDLPAEDQRRPRHVPHGHGHGGRREGLRLLPARAEPGRRLGARQAAAPGHGEPGLGGRPRPRHDRERHVLEGLAGDRDRRDRPRDVPHGGVLLPRRLARGEGGHVHPDAAHGAVAGEGGRADRRPALGPVVLLPPGPDGQGAAGGVDGPARRARAEAGLELPRGRRPGRGRSRRPKTSCGGSTATTSPPASPSTATSSSRPTAPPPAAAGSTPASTRTG